MKRKKGFKLMVLAICMMSIFVNIPLEVDAAPASGLSNGGRYFIRNKHSYLYLDVEWPDYRNVAQHGYNGSKNQQWRLEYMDSGTYSGYYRIRSLINDKVLDVYANDNNNGSNIDVFSDANAGDRRWEIKKNSDDTYRILSLCSNRTKGVTVQNASTSPGANVFQYEYTPGSYQNDDWIFEPFCYHEWNHSSYQGGYAPKSGNMVVKSNYDNVRSYTNISSRVTFNLDSYNVAQILDYNDGGDNPGDRGDGKQCYLTLDISHVRPSNDATDNLSAVNILTNLPNPVFDFEDDDLLGGRDEESEVVALGKVEAKEYFMQTIWRDYRSGSDAVNGTIQAQFAVSAKGVLDYNNVYTSSAVQATHNLKKEIGKP